VWISALSRRDVSLPDARLPLFFEETTEYKKLAQDYELLKKARKDYKASLNSLVARLRGWRADDPVSKLYASVFQTQSIVEAWSSRDEQEHILREWETRLRDQRPPGYKDGGKGPDAIYARPELVDEYRQSSGGRTISIVSLYELLAEMKVESDIVLEVKEAEQEANIDSSSLLIPVQMGVRKFDYSTNNGVIRIAGNESLFTLKFANRSNDSIYLTANGTVTAIARVKGGGPDQRIKFSDYDSSSDSYAIHTGEYFLARNKFGAVLLGRLDAVKDDERGDDRDEVDFTFKIAPTEEWTLY